MTREPREASPSTSNAAPEGFPSFRRSTESQVGYEAEMKAVVYRSYGPPEVLHLEDVPKPLIKDD